jgi:isocitrate dehydrogenase kinase/phosphatase
LSRDVTVYSAADAIYASFDRYHATFKEITRRARAGFEQRDWHGIQRDDQERLDLYRQAMTGTVAELHQILKHRLRDTSTWAQMKAGYTNLIHGRDDAELAETFFNSTTRRVFTTIGVNPDIEFVDFDFESHLAGSEEPIFRTYLPQGQTRRIIERILRDCRFDAPFDDLGLDARLVADRIEAELLAGYGDGSWDRMEILRSIFYRNKGAYIIGRICKGVQFVPLVLPLINTEAGIQVDAVLMHSDEASIVFSFTRSYFHVEVARPEALIQFLKSIMPHKPVTELYISIGYFKFGKTELYRDLVHHLRQTDDRFVIAPGERGMVMVAFTLHSLPVIFKVIKDRFEYPKSTTREKVMEKYHLVFKRDRVGRLVDAQEFEYMQFEKDFFSSELLQELRTQAAKTVSVEDDTVIIKHLYTERRLTPLNLYLKQVSSEKACEAAIDYGNAIKELMAANIFPGDVFLKNFGVTRHGRVVFYDYDELCLLTQCNFRMIPPSQHYEDDFFVEPWFRVEEHDVFPEEFANFFGLYGQLRDVFFAQHGDLCDVDFWREMQARQQNGEIMDFFPYKESARLQRYGVGP